MQLGEAEAGQNQMQAINKCKGVIQDQNSKLQYVEQAYYYLFEEWA